MKLQNNGISTTCLKWIALICMVFDHVAEFIPYMPIWFRWIGRISAPIFVFCMVEGIKYTKNRKKYLIRLYTASVIMAVIQTFTGVSNNYFLPLFCTAFFLKIIIEKTNIKRRIILYVTWQILSFLIILSMCCFYDENLITMKLIPALLGSYMFSESGLFALIEGLLFYYAYNNKKRITILYSVFCGIFALFSLKAYIPIALSYIQNIPIIGDVISEFIELTLMGYFEAFAPIYNGGSPLLDNYQWMQIFTLPVLLYYNGEKGIGMKKFFYIFYILHICILWGISTYIF